MKKKLFYPVLLFLCAGMSRLGMAQQLIPVETAQTSLYLSVDAKGKLQQAYFGDKLADTATLKGSQVKTHESYIPFGMDNLFEPAIRITHADGNPSLDLRYDSYTTEHTSADITHTIITLKDPVYPVKVLLHFSTYYQENVFKAWTEIVHQEKKPVVLSNFASSMLHFDADHYWLTQFHGDWAMEMKQQESELTAGIKILDSKLGSRAHMYQTPVFFLSKNKPSTETEGAVMAGTLGWSGNFQLLFEVDEKNSLRVISGINPFASEYTLEAGKNFTTPEFIFTYTSHGKGEASRNLHRWARNYGVMDGNGSRFVLLNNWESTGFDFNEQKLSAIFKDATNLGADLFLLDDGWFGNRYPRNDDHTSLGDWDVNKAKLPNGIGHLVKEAQANGVKFGIWLEPEMISPKSELYEKHPDWVLKLPNREENYFRNQLVLDLINPAVQDFVYNTVNDMLVKNPGIAYIKWDCNRMMTNTYSPYLKDKQSHVYIEYVRSLYKVLERLRKQYPALPMMLCSGGGGRTDYGALKYFTEFWPSDDTDPVERVFIQWGFSGFFPAITMSNHITSWGKQPLKYRTDVAMMGRMGYDIDVEKLSANDLAFSKEAIKTYKRINPVILKGDLYRLVDPYQNNRAVLMYADSTKSKAVLFAYNLHSYYGQRWENVILQGLDASKRYTVKEINLYPGTNASLQDDGKVFTGEYLMKVGLQVSSGEALTSKVIEISSL